MVEDIRKVRVNGTVLTIPADHKVVLVEKRASPFSKTRVREIKTEFRKIITPKRQKEVVDFLTKTSDERRKKPINVSIDEAEISKYKDYVEVKVDKEALHDKKFILTEKEWKMLDKGLHRVAHGTQQVVGKIVDEIKKRRKVSKSRAKSKKMLKEEVGLFVGG